MVSKALAQWTVQLDIQSVPSSVVDKAKAVLLDFLGVSLFVSRNTPWGKTIAQYAAREGGTAEATILGYDLRTSPGLAALANGTMALGFEYEDVHMGSTLHPYPAVVPAALSMAEREKASGRGLLAAIVVGYEVMTRAGMASGASLGRPTITRGLYPTHLYGVFGAAAAAGKILALPTEPMVMAFGLAAEQAAGTMQSHAEGAWSRRLHGGKAAQSGVTAAALSQMGFIGPQKVFEGDYSIYRTYGLDFAPDEINRDLGSRFEILDGWFKAHSCCGDFHAAIDLVLRLKHEHNIQPYEVSEIRASLAGLSPLFKRKDFPTIIAAQFSLPFCIALAMLKDRVSPKEFTEQSIHDHEITAYARDRIETIFDDELERRGASARTAPARVIIRLINNKEYSDEAMYPLGHPKYPMTPEQHRAKVFDLMATVIKGKAIEEIYAMVQSLDQLDDVTRLTHVIRKACI